MCHQDDVCENSIGSVYVGGYCGLADYVSSVNCVKLAFLCVDCCRMIILVELSTMSGCIVC